MSVVGTGSGATDRQVQYLGQYDERHIQAATIPYEARWKPPESIQNNYGTRRQFKCTGMRKSMRQENQKLNRYAGHEEEFTRNGYDIHLKMRVRGGGGSSQYGVNMCWLCISHHKDGAAACAVAGHTCMGFNGTKEAFRSQKDWLTDAQKDPHFSKGLPSETTASGGLHSVEAQILFMDHTLNIFPAVASPMAYPEGGMPPHIKEWYCTQWGEALTDQQLFEHGVRLMRCLRNLSLRPSLQTSNLGRNAK